MQVLIDTNVLLPDYWMRSGELQLLLMRARNQRLTLIVPEVVVREAVSNFRRELYSCQEELMEADERIRRLCRTRHRQLTSRVDVEAEVVKYERYLREELARARAVVAPIPSVSHDELLDRAVRRRKPFGEKGNGYRDTLIWLNVLEAARRGSVVFVSKNRKDFGTRAGDLDATLQTEVDNLGEGPDRVTLFNELRQFRERYIEETQGAERLIQEVLQGDPLVREKFWGEVKNAVSKQLANQQRTSVPVPGVREVWVSDARLAALDVTAAFGVDSESTVVDVEAVGTAIVNFRHLSEDTEPMKTSRFTDPASFEEIVRAWPVEDDFETGYFSTDFRATLTAVFDSRLRTLSEITVSDLAEAF